MKLYLVRHGETELNKQYRYIGRTDVGLSAEGKRQAEALAEYLKAEGITAIYSSDLKRAAQTAGIIAKPLSINIKLTKDLREIDFGDWEGLTYAEIDALDHEYFQSWMNDPVAVAIPGGERWDRFEHRVLRAVESIVEHEKDGNVIAVSHGGPIRIIMTHLNGDDGEYFKAFWPSPGGLSVVEIEGLTRRILLENKVLYKRE